jgi:hypothetical protein
MYFVQLPNFLDVLVVCSAWVGFALVPQLMEYFSVVVRKEASLRIVASHHDATPTPRRSVQYGGESAAGTLGSRLEVKLRHMYESSKLTFYSI